MRPGRLGLCELAVLLTVLAVLPVLVVQSPLAAGDMPSESSGQAPGGRDHRESPAASGACPGAQQTIGRYRKAYTRSRAIMGLPGAVPRQWYPCPAARRRALEWRDKAELARRHADSWVQWNYSWQTWMPRGSKWYRVASCETGYGQDPNWSHDSGTYVSAFGIYRPGYADDAHRIGALSWDETVRVHGRVPTPREQYEAALSHYRAHGGFSGWGCRGA